MGCIEKNKFKKKDFSLAQLTLATDGRKKGGIFVQNPCALAGRIVLHEPPSYVLFLSRSIHTTALQHREYHRKTTASSTTENVSTPMQTVIPLDYQWKKKAFMK